MVWNFVETLTYKMSEMVDELVFLHQPPPRGVSSGNNN